VDRWAEFAANLADATTMEATSGEAARQTAKKHDGLDLDLKNQMKICSNNYINFESEICALKKIRGELYKKLKGGHSAFFQDCKVSDWTKEECNKKMWRRRRKTHSKCFDSTQQRCEMLAINGNKEMPSRAMPR